MKKGSDVSPALAAGLICLVLGGAIGFYARDAQMRPASAASGGMGGGKGMSPGGFGGGQGGGGAAAQPTSGRDLARLVTGLGTIEKVQGKGLTAAQKQQLLPLLTGIQKADALPEAEASAKLEAMKKTLTAEQQQTLADLQPQRGGRGGAGGTGGGGGGAPTSGAPRSGGTPPPMMGGGGGMSGAQPDPNKPFASERNKKALEDLIANIK